MGNRGIWKSALTAGCIVAAIAVARLGTESGTPALAAPLLGARPDIVMIQLDDDVFHRIKHLNGVPGGTRLQAAFRRHGLRYRFFPNHYVTTPVCGPSRASTLTAQYAHRHGVKWNNPSATDATDGGCAGFTGRDLDRSTIATWLRDGGYHTIAVGKYLNGYENTPGRPGGFVPPGWDDWAVFFDHGHSGYWNYSLSENGTIVPYPPRSDADYSTDRLLERAIRLVGSVSDAVPFFLYFNPVAPHSPSTPAPRHENLRPGLVAPRPPGNPAYLEEDVADKSAWVRALPYPPTPMQINLNDTLYRKGANSLAAVTEAIAAIMDALAAKGRLDRTIFILTNDNGKPHLDHRLVAKRNFYDVAARTYLIVASSDPALVPSSGRNSSLTSNIDIAPTIASLAQVAVPEGHRQNGVSFVPLLQSGDGPPVRTDLLIENFGPEPSREPDMLQDFPAFQAIVTGEGHSFPRWKLARFDDGQRELYDLIADPYELTNVADDPANAAVVASLEARLDQLADE